jgi:hypothetical protein
MPVRILTEESVVVVVETRGTGDAIVDRGE